MMEDPHNDKNELEELIQTLLSDLKQPINNGKAYCALFLNEIPIVEGKQHEYHADILRQFETLNQLVEQYLRKLINRSGE